MKKIVIIGGVAAGASCAARLRRLDENAEIIVLERGEYISFANCGLPYYIGGVITRRQNLLLNSPESLRSRFNIDVRVMNKVTGILPAEKTVEVKKLS
ncbi:MAG: FAD-dependent oxidoreductase, partial [Ignavibacteriales bacterium]